MSESRIVVLREGRHHAENTRRKGNHRYEVFVLEINDEGRTATVMIGLAHGSWKADTKKCKLSDAHRRYVAAALSELEQRRRVPQLNTLTNVLRNQVFKPSNGWTLTERTLAEHKALQAAA